MVLTLSEIKAQLRVDDDYEDDLLEAKILAAEAHIESLIGKSFDDYEGDVPEPLKEAVRMLVGHWFDNREAVSEDAQTKETPFGVWQIVNEHRVWSF